MTSCSRCGEGRKKKENKEKRNRGNEGGWWQLGGLFFNERLG